MECRGRRGVTFDLTTEEGRRLARKLCLTADIVAENNRGGMMAKLGLDYDDLVADNPGLIYVASQGYGRGGPMGEMKAWGPLQLVLRRCPRPVEPPGDGPYPCGTSLNHPDHIAGKLLATAVLAQLDERSRTGRGGLIEMAQTEAAVYLLGELYLEAIETGVDPVNLANRDRVMAPHGVYPAAGDDKWVAIAVRDDAWAALEELCGWDHDPSLAAQAARHRAHDEIDARLAKWTGQRDPAEAAALLQAAGVSAMPVMGPLDHLADPHLEQRGLMVDLVHPHHGPERQPANPTRMSRDLDANRAVGAPPRRRHRRGGCARCSASTTPRSAASAPVAR